MADPIKTLQNLSRLAEKEVEDHQRALAESQRKLEALTARIQTMEASADQGLKDADENPDLLSMALAYHSRIRTEVGRLRQNELPPLEKDVADQRDALAEAFATQKRYNILLERKLEEIKKRRAKAEQGQLDEVAQDRHQRGDDKA